jgi:hypothetical protein
MEWTALSKVQEPPVFMRWGSIERLGELCTCFSSTLRSRAFFVRRWCVSFSRVERISSALDERFSRVSCVFEGASSKQN